MIVKPVIYKSSSISLTKIHNPLWKSYFDDRLLLLNYVSLYCCRIFRKTMVITYKNIRFKIKINGILNNQKMSTTLILIIDWWNNRVKPIKSTEHSVTWLFLNPRIQIKGNCLIMKPKQEAVPNSDIKLLVIKTPCSRLVHILYFLGTVMLLLSDFQNDDFTKVVPPP